MEGFDSVDFDYLLNDGNDGTAIHVESRLLKDVITREIEKTIKSEITKKSDHQFNIPPIKNIMRLYNSNKNRKLGQAININHDVRDTGSLHDAGRILGNSFSNLITVESKKF